MKNIKPAIVLYVIAIAITILASYFNNDLLLLIAKPIIIPAIFFYYLQLEKFKVNWLFTIALLSDFITDMIVLFQIGDAIYTILFLNTITYLILGYFVISDLSLRNLGNEKIVYIILAFVGNYFILYFVLDLIEVSNTNLFYAYLIYGLILTTFSSIVGINFFSKNNLKYTYASIMCGCFVLSDAFYALFNYYIKLDAFNILNMITQFASYYYMVKYITSKSIKESID